MYPSLSQFQQWASSFNAIPVWMEPELPSGSLLEWAHNLIGGQQRFFFLHSASAGPQARYSYLALDTPRYVAEVHGGSLSIKFQSESGAGMDALKVGNPLARFEQWISRWRTPRVEALPPFWGGAVGYFGYESARYCEPGLNKIFSAQSKRAGPSGDLKFPDFEFAVYDTIAAIDHARQRLWLVHTVLLPEGRRLSPAQIERLYRNAQERLRRHAVRLQRALRKDRVWSGFNATELKSNRSPAAYQLMVRRAKGFISSGDIYQANVSQAFSANWQGDPWTLYRHLTEINPSPYAALWRNGSRWIASSSPELLARQEADRIETRPIAGTHSRGATPWDDEQILKSLIKDPKELAEHIMLVDLERNDLGRICRPNTVQVAESLAVETYSHVYHLVSDIRGTLLSGKTWADTLRACFPGGTITGCPKIRSMEVIARLESEIRGPYCGSLGWIGFNGDMTLNILIRTFFLNEGHLRFPVGAGIVADSLPRQEYDETLHKARALLAALARPNAPSALFKYISRRRRGGE